MFSSFLCSQNCTPEGSYHEMYHFQPSQHSHTQMWAGSWPGQMIRKDRDAKFVIPYFFVPRASLVSALVGTMPSNLSPPTPPHPAFPTHTGKKKKKVFYCIILFISRTHLKPWQSSCCFLNLHYICTGFLSFLNIFQNNASMNKM